MVTPEAPVKAVKAANVPMVPNCPLPEALLEATDTLIVGLTTNPERLVQIRRNRLLSLKENSETEYVDPDAVKREVGEARKLFGRYGWPVIGAGKQHTIVTALWLSQPGFQHGASGFGQGYAAFFAPLADYPHVSAGA